MPDPVPTSATRLPFRSRPRKVREEFAGEKISGVEHGRSDRKPETRHPRHRSPATFEDEMIRQKVDGLAQKLLERPSGQLGTAETVVRRSQVVSGP